MKLYSICILGERFYFLGTLSQTDITQIEVFCKQIFFSDKETNPDHIFDSVIRHIQTKALREVIPIAVSHVFRIFD